jgi:hypothetical protein
MVTRNEASCSSSGKRMAAADIVAGNAANDRTPYATFG